MIKYSFLALIPAAFLITGCIEQNYPMIEVNNPFIRPFTDPVYMPDSPHSYHNEERRKRQGYNPHDEAVYDFFGI